MSGRLILNLETVFALATVLLLLWRCKPSGWSPSPSPLFNRHLRRPPNGLRRDPNHHRFLARPKYLPSSDDFVLVSMSQVFHATFGPGSYATMFTHGGGDGFFRPLGYSSLFWASQWAGLDPVRWHSAALALHIVNALLVFVLAGAVGLPRAGAWLASGLFALHGAHPEAVVWIAGRFDVLATFFVLIALVAFIRFWESPSLLAGVIAALAMTLGILSKESAYATPLMMLVFVTSRKGIVETPNQFLSPFVLLAAALFAYRWTFQGGIGGYLTAEGKPQILTLSALSIAKALGLRLWTILFFPIDWAVGVRARGDPAALRRHVDRAGNQASRTSRQLAAPPPVHSRRRRPSSPAVADRSRFRKIPLALSTFRRVLPLRRGGGGFRGAPAALRRRRRNVGFQSHCAHAQSAIWQDVAGKSKTVCEALAALRQSQRGRATEDSKRSLFLRQRVAGVHSSPAFAKSGNAHARLPGC